VANTTGLTYEPGSQTLTILGSLDKKAYRRLLASCVHHKDSAALQARIRDLRDRSSLYVGDDELQALETYARRMRGEIFFAERWLMVEEAEFIDREKLLWEQISEVEGELRGSVALLENGFRLLTSPAGLREYGEDDTCELAAAVVEIHAFADAYGDASLWRWLDALHAFQGDSDNPGVVNEAVIKQVGTALAEGPRKPAEVPCRKYLH